MKRNEFIAMTAARYAALWVPIETESDDRYSGKPWDGRWRFAYDAAESVTEANALADELEKAGRAPWDAAKADGDAS